MRLFVSSTLVSYPPYCLGPFASVIFCFDGIMGPEKKMKPGFYPPWIQNHHFDDVGSSTPKETPDRIKSRKSHLYKSSKPVPNASRRAAKKKMEHVPQDWLEEIGSFFFTCNNLVYSLWSQRCSRLRCLRFNLTETVGAHEFYVGFLPGVVRVENLNEHTHRKLVNGNKHVVNVFTANKDIWVSGSNSNVRIKFSENCGVFCSWCCR